MRAPAHANTQVNLRVDAADKKRPGPIRGVLFCTRLKRYH